MGIFSMRPGEVGDVSGQLAVLADRVCRVMDAEALNLTVAPSARDEVSQRVASTLNEVHTAFSSASTAGDTQLHDLARSLRAHTDRVVASDDDLAV